MSVTRKALAVVSAVILALAGLHLTQGILQHNAALEAAILAEEEAIDATVEDLERHVYGTYGPRLRYVLENNPAIRSAFAARDRGALLAAARPRLEGLRAENAALHAWDFNLPDGTVFLRVQDPPSHGDNLAQTRPILQAVHETRAAAEGYDVGRHGVIFWVAQPVVHEGAYAGATELGLETGQLLQALRSRFGTEVALVVRAERWRKALLVKEGYRAAGDRVLIAPAGSAYLRLPDAPIFAPERDRRVALDGRDLILHKCASLRDFRGELVASVLVLQDVTGRLARRRAFVAGSVLASGLLLALGFGVLSASFATLIGRLEVSAAETRHAKDEVERARDALEVRVQERTADLWCANRTLEEQVAELNRMGGELREAHGRLLRVLDGLEAIVYVADLKTHEILFANRHATETCGELVGKPCWATIQSGQTGPCAFCTNEKLVGPDGEPAGANSWEFRNAERGRWYAIQERAIRWVDGRLVRLAIATDTTQRHEAEERLRASLREKEVLIKEIHHRVKNNMQIVSSLLNLQADAGGPEPGSLALRESQARIQALALIHDMLYRSGDLAHIDLGDYLRGIADRLVRTYAAPGGPVRAEVGGERILLGIDTAVPCGLIVNELVTNALKHAFPGGRGGTVRVDVARVADPSGGEGSCEIVVRDDGVGLPAAVVPGRTPTLGLRLVFMLAHHQLQGTLEVGREHGTRFSVRFRELPYPART